MNTRGMRRIRLGRRILSRSERGIETEAKIHAHGLLPLSRQTQRHQLGRLVGPAGGDGDVLLAAGHIGDGLARGVARQLDFAHQRAVVWVKGPEIGRIGIDFDLDGVASGRVVDHVPLRLRRGE